MIPNRSFILSLLVAVGVLLALAGVVVTTSSASAGGCSSGGCSSTAGAACPTSGCGHAGHAARPASQGASTRVDTSPWPAPTAGQVRIEGRVLCTSCELKRTAGAGSQCGVHGCAHAIRVTSARDHRGRLLRQESGRIYHILGNAASAELLKKESKNRELRLVGRLHSDANVVEVFHYRLLP